MRQRRTMAPQVPTGRCAVCFALLGAGALVCGSACEATARGLLYLPPAVLAEDIETAEPETAAGIPRRFSKFA